MKLWVILLGMVITKIAFADESDIQLKEGPGKELVSAHCAVCHSLDYIPMNSAFLDRKGWEKTVDKMIHAMGAQVPPEDVAPIVDYLERQYGK
ncbi:c-type cytochrome [Methylosarcina fibrata]|uniref:c-type cytochrome n=1 Tax=Methylosarcina fibrata TaxID=105972 RepID=UPI0003682485|nr:cytochrome c [Methylosarcina fibrata]